MFRASLCPSSGAQEYYTVVAALFHAVVFKLLVRFGAEGYVSGLQDAAASCTKYHGQQLQGNTLELLMMGIVVPETC